MRRNRGVRITALLAACATALCACVAQSTADDETFAIAGGFPSGVYYAYGEQLAEAMATEADLDVEVVATAGSVENLLRVGSGEALLGFAQSDAAADAVTGSGAFSEPLEIRAVARLYDEYVHVVVRADSDMHALSDFAGRRVSLGAANSGVNAVAERVLDAAGVSRSEVTDAHLGLEDCIEALARGDIDGFFWVGGLPTPGLMELAESTPIRMLPIDPETTQRANQGRGDVYRSVEFPVGVYGMIEPLATMTVPNLLITSATAEDHLVEEALTVLFASKPSLALQVPAIALLDIRQAIFTMPIELHPAAMGYYRDTRM